jgi:hypothetical protein
MVANLTLHRPLVQCAICRTDAGADVNQSSKKRVLPRKEAAGKKGFDSCTFTTIFWFTLILSIMQASGGGLAADEVADGGGGDEEDGAEAAEGGGALIDVEGEDAQPSAHDDQADHDHAGGEGIEGPCGVGGGGLGGLRSCDMGGYAFCSGVGGFFGEFKSDQHEKGQHDADDDLDVLAVSTEEGGDGPERVLGVNGGIFGEAKAEDEADAKAGESHDEHVANADFAAEQTPERGCKEGDHEEGVDRDDEVLSTAKPGHEDRCDDQERAE